MLLTHWAPARVEAQEQLGTVVIVRVPKDTPVAARIRAELEANEWRVRELGPDASTARAPLPSLASSHRARAALRMNPARAAVELWVASEGGAGGGGEVVRLPAGETDAALLALRATEALRARGLRLPRQATRLPLVVSGGAPGTPSESSPPAAASEGTPEPTAAAEERARKQAEEAAARAEREQREREQAEREAKAQAERERLERERLEQEAEERADREAEARADAEEAEEEAAEAKDGEAEAAAVVEAPTGRPRPALLSVEGGPAIAASQRGADPSWAGWIHLRFQPAAAWSISGFGFLPFAGGSIRSDRGSGWVRSFMLGGTIDLHGAFGRLDLSAGAGAATLITLTRATPDIPRYESTPKGPEITGAALARVALHVAVAPRIRVGARVMFGLGFPELHVEFEEEVVATWGQPFVVVALVVDLGLPFFTR